MEQSEGQYRNQIGDRFTHLEVGHLRNGTGQTRKKKKENKIKNWYFRNPSMVVLPSSVLQKKKNLPYES